MSNLVIDDRNGDASRVQMNPREDRTTRAIPLASRSESLQKHIVRLGWLSTSIVHDLRNPLGTVSAGSEMLMEHDLAPAQVKRLAANIHRAAIRMHELLAELAGASGGNKSTFQVCKIRHIAERTQAIIGRSAEYIAAAAQQFGQNDDITVVKLRYTPVEAHAVQ